MQKKAEKKEIIDLEKVEVAGKFNKEIERSMQLLERAFKKISELKLIAEQGDAGELVISIKMAVKMGLVIREIKVPAGQWNYKEDA